MPGAKIMVVEDEWLVTKGIVKKLKKLGYEVEEQAVSGPEAIEKARATHPDLILMDIKLQGEMDGIEAADEIRRQDNVPIIFLTAHADPLTLDRAKVTEPFGYLLKPFEERELHTAIEIALYKSRAEKRLQHLNKVLLAIRNVNQLIVQEKDRDQLIRKACQLLTEGRSYYKAWIALLDPNDKVEKYAAEGKHYDTTQLLDMLRQGNLPECGCQALFQKKTIINENMSFSCVGCPLLQDPENHGSLITRLTHEGKQYGVIGVCLPTIQAQDEEELSLFEDLATDISLALYKIDLEEREQQALEALRASEKRVKAKLDHIMAPEGDIGRLELGDIVDVEAIQALMENLYQVTRIGMAILDLKGNVLVGVGWQDICIKFHRVNPETRQRCLESDTILTQEVQPGTYKIYKCKNNMWDMVTPIVIGGKHLGNLFLGQFFFDDESPEEDFFRNQAQKQGFDEEEYLAALSRVPRWSREKVDLIMHFYSKLASMISILSLSNIKLARSLSEQERLMQSLQESERRLRLAQDAAKAGTWEWDLQTNENFWSEEIWSLYGLEPHCCRPSYEVWYQTVHPNDRLRIEQEVQEAATKGSTLNIEWRVCSSSGLDRWLMSRGQPLRDANGYLTRYIGIVMDITERKRVEESLRIALDESNRHRREIQGLLAATNAVIEKDNFESAAREIFNACCEITGAISGYVALLSEDGAENEVLFLESGGLPCSVDESLPMPIRGLRGEAYRDKKVVYDNDFSNSKWMDFMPAGHVDLDNVLFAPLISGDRAIGLIGLANKPSGFNDQDAKITAALAEIATVALQNAIYHEKQEKAEKMLRESEERFRSYFELSLIGAAITSPEKHWLAVNDKLCQIVGYSREELTRLTWEEMTHPEDIEENIIYFNQALSGEIDAYSLEKRFFRKDGQIINAVISVRASRRPSGEVEYFLVNLQDISERKRAEQEIIKQRQYYMDLVESLDGVVWEATIEPLAFTYISPKLNSMLGYDPDKWLGSIDGWLNMIDPEDRQQALSHCIGETKAGKDHVLEFKATTADGQKKWVRESISLVWENGKNVALRGIMMDITDRKKMEEALQEKTAIAQTFMDALPCVALLLKTGTREIVALNKAARDAGAQLGATCYGSWLRFDKACNFCRAPESWATGMQQSLEVEAIGVFWEAYWVPITEDLYLHYALDITERKQAEEEKQRLKEQLYQAQKVEAIGTLAGGIAHDFNNILWAIMGFTEMSLTMIPEESKIQKNLKQVLRASERAKDLVNQILAFSRKASYELKPVQVSLIIKEVLKMMRATLPTTIDINTDISAPNSLVLADPTQLHQVMVNLCTNAGHAMREHGGILGVKLEEIILDDDQVAHYEGISPGSYVMLTVRDTGHGIDHEIVDRIFDPFFTTKFVGEGTGMGLAVVHGIVKSHQGTIRVSSQTRVGTTFTILLPQILMEKSEETEALKPIPTGNNRILIIDDEEMLVSLIKEMLESLGYAVKVSNSSQEALKIFQSQPDFFDLVITDQTMPHLTGLQLAREFRQNQPDIPIILCTGFSDKVSEETIQATGINALLMKPINLRDLGETVSMVLGKENQ